MKRILSILLYLAVAASLVFTATAATGSTGFAAGTIRSFTLEGDSAYMNRVETADADAINALRSLLASARKSVRSDGDEEEALTLTVQSADKARSFSLTRAGETYILSHDGQRRQVSYEQVNNLINSIGSAKVYRFRSPPLATVTVNGEELEMGGGTDTGIVKGDLRYRRLSGNFNAAIFPENTDMFDLPYTADKSLYLPTFAYQPETVAVRVNESGKGQIWQGSLEQARSYQLPGRSDYSIYLDLTFDNAYLAGSVTYGYGMYYADTEGMIQFAVEGGDTHLGEVVILRVTGTTAADPLATFTSDIGLNLPPKFHRQADGSQIALFPVSYRNTAGSHWLTITCGEESAQFKIVAKDKKWQIQNLTVSGSTAAETINSQKANDEYERVIAPLRSVADDEKHWSGRFILPVSDQRVTTEFGMIRYVNGSATSERHGALDLAVPQGTPVKATGAGRVLYAGFLQLTGNTVLIEHGYGLKSWYYHMDSLSVKTGDMVEQGKVIGAVGSTGFSTGPHLHFGMSVNNVFINPYTAINTDLLA